MEIKNNTKITDLIDRKRAFMVRKYVGQNCTLDSEPARIVGRFLSHGVVRTEKYDVQFSWQAIERVMEAGGKFKT